MMKNFWKIMAMVILVVAIILIFDKLFTPQPIQIVLQSGEEITTQNSDYFTMVETILLVVCSFLVGTTATYLFYNSGKEVSKISDPEEISRPAEVGSSEKIVTTFEIKDKYETILPLLKDDEKKLVIFLKEAGGEMLQNQLVLKMNLSKVKITRVIAGLESKNLVAKERNGLTNCIRLV